MNLLHITVSVTNVFYVSMPLCNTFDVSMPLCNTTFASMPLCNAIEGAIVLAVQHLLRVNAPVQHNFRVNAPVQRTWRSNRSPFDDWLLPWIQVRRRRGNIILDLIYCTSNFPTDNHAPSLKEKLMAIKNKRFFRISEILQIQIKEITFDNFGATVFSTKFKNRPSSWR